MLFGTKPELRIEGNIAYLGVLDLLHMSRDAKLDIQTGANMGFFSPELAPAEGRVLAEGDPADPLWRGRGRGSRPGRRPRSARRPEGREEVLLRAGGSGSVGSGRQADAREPVHAGALAPVDPAVAREHDSTSTRGRILMTRVMTRLHLCPNLLAFQRTGRPDPSLDELTHANFPHVPKDMHIVCAWDMDEGPLFLVRNPNTTSREAVLVWNVHLGGLKRYRGRGLVFFSFAACELLARLNGADFDDSVLATTDSRYIAKWLTHGLPRHREALGAGRLQPDAYPQCGTGPSGIRDIRRWTSSTANVGSFINDVMLDTLLSGPNRLHAIQSTQGRRVLGAEELQRWRSARVRQAGGPAVPGDQDGLRERVRGEQLRVRHRLVRDAQGRRARGQGAPRRRRRGSTGTRMRRASGAGFPATRRRGTWMASAESRPTARPRATTSWSRPRCVGR